MMSYKKLIVVSGVCLSCIFSLPTMAATSLLGYSIPIDYTSDGKTDTNVVGGYGYFGYNSESVEIEYDRVTERSGGALYQQDFLGMYTYYGLPYTRLKAGMHYVQSVGEGVDGIVYIAGAAFDQVGRYGYQSATLGMDLYASTYTNSTRVIQVSPYITSYFQPAWPFGYYDLTTKVNLIAVSGAKPETLKGVETALTCNFYPWKLAAKAWFGESKYGVYSGGNIVYNTADLLLHGYGVSATYSFSPVLSLKLGYQLQYLQVDGETSVSNVSKLSYMLGYNF
jgi:hypothetical protein